MSKGTKYGMIGGAAFGVFFAAFFSLAARLVCSGNLECPGHWAPYLYMSLIAWGVCTVLGAFAGTVVALLYRLLKVG